MFKARTGGVRTRILVIAFVPSVALLTIGVGTAGYLYSTSRDAHDWLTVLSGTNNIGGPLVDAFQQERMQSLWQETGQNDPAAIAHARQQADTALAAVAPIQKMVNNNAYGKKASYGEEGFNNLTASLPRLRAGIDAGALPVPDTYNVFNQILDGIEDSSGGVVKDAPNPTITLEMQRGLQLLMALESLSRGIALTGVVLNGATLPPAMLDDYRNQVGFYRTELPPLVGQLIGSDKEVGKSIVNSPAWQQLAAMEEWVIHPGVTKSGAIQPPPMSEADWRAAATDVSTRILQLWNEESVKTNKSALDAVNRTSRNAALAGGGALAISVLAFVIAVLLANRLIGRLQRLRTQTLALAEEQLPDVTRRLAAGEQLDTTTLSAQLDFGSDEVGQVARAFSQAHDAAIDAALTEARTREGVRAVFLNIAHRSQIVVHRLLEILDEAESQQEDPTTLDTLFRLDHLATRERRNAENLIILGGGQPGRQWRRPVPLVEVVRSAVGETLDYVRVHTSRMPEAYVIGAVVADLIHLLAELVDNATSFSPPESHVGISGAVVGRGVVIEISDQGMGMQPADMERSNQMLAEPPDFGVAALTSDSRLGLFVVAQLAGRHGISVRLNESDYGGVRAIVLVPMSLTASPDVAAVDHLPDRFTRIPDPPRTGEFPSVAQAWQLPAATGTATAWAPEPTATAWTQEPPAAAWAQEPPAAAWTQEPAPPRHDARTAHHGYPTRPPLPRRRKQASLAPELAEQRAAENESQRPRSAEQARDLLSAIDNGTRQGRREIGAPAYSEEQDGEGDLFPRR
ncbi:nitrate- and nitrite sensing domain-containing protein [Nocardia sp. alder85J]|uniref:sensor histidine kinase n=1 Tax=Nocardia sp. alder85J TaxID=2862949 RepID=UPI001CD27F1D|nr:nitrate- and nitrite sensing domain-containing protein [Nocardia sp. alder85J]MCX4095354.1 nitrate- and nitrite sensing domain-containing protein [Nocardia sp. alder85J]